MTEDIVSLKGKNWQVSYTETDEENTTVITNSLTEIHILKVDVKNSEPLAGAEFRLEKRNGETWEVFRDQITVGEDGDEKGLATVEGLTNGTYTLRETKAPPGYTPLGTAVGFTVEDGVVRFTNTEHVTYDAQTATFRVENKTGLVMPSTGGPGTLAWTAGGLALILLAGGLLLRRKRKNMI